MITEVDATLSVSIDEALRDIVFVAAIESFFGPAGPEGGLSIEWCLRVSHIVKQDGRRDCKDRQMISVFAETVLNNAKEAGYCICIVAEQSQCTLPASNSTYLAQV